MPYLAAHFPVYALVSHDNSVSRMFVGLVIAEIVSQVKVIMVKAEIADDDDIQTKANCTPKLHPSGCSSYTYIGSKAGLPYYIDSFCRSADIVIVESETKLPNLTSIVLGGGEKRLSGDSINVDGFENNPIQAAQRILEHAQQKLLSSPVWACILIGGKSSRMGQAKHLIKDPDGLTWLEKMVRNVTPHVQGVALSGAGDIPSSLRSYVRLPDIPQVAGPLTGIIAAMRWQPEVSWLLLACDMPAVTSEALSWMLGKRHLGSWARVPAVNGKKGVEPLLACYERQSAAYFEQMRVANIRRISAIVNFDRIDVVQIPDSLQNAWCNVNTPDELHNYSS